MVLVSTLAPFVRTGFTLSMGRRGWTSADASGWVQIIRGPRPPSVKWPRVGQQFRQPTPPSQPRLHRFVVNQVKTSGTRPFVDPRVKMPAAKERAQKLELALPRHLEGVGRSTGSIRCEWFLTNEEEVQQLRGIKSSSRLQSMRSHSSQERESLPEELDHHRSQCLSEHRVVEDALARIEGSVPQCSRWFLHGGVVEEDVHADLQGGIGVPMASTTPRRCVRRLSRK